MTELFDILFTDLRSSKKSINRLLSIGILFALFGHFYVVKPYFPYKAKERSQAELRDVVKKLRKDIKDTLGDIEYQIEAYPAHLREVQNKIYDTIYPNPSSKPLPVGKIIIPPDTTYENGMHLYVEHWFSNLLDKLNNEVANKVSDLNSKYEMLEVLDHDIKADIAIKSFKYGLEKLEIKNPSIWFDYEGDKGDVATALLQENLDSAFAPVNSKVSNLLIRTEGRLIEIEEDIKELENRMRSLQSPLGPIPVGLADFVVLFPLVIVILAVMITAALHKSSRLYTAFWREFKKNKNSANSIIFQQLTDCWYLPRYTNVFQRWSLPVLLGAGIYMFLMASYRTISGFSLVAEDIPSLTKNLYLIISTYGVGILVIVACAWFVWKTLRRISEESIG